MNDENKKVNSDTALEVIDDENELAAIPTGLEVQLDAAKALGRIQQITTVIDGCTKISLQRTNPRDWVRMTDGQGVEKFYLQASGVQKVRAIWGIYYEGRTMKKEQLPNGHFSYITEGRVGSRVLDGLYGQTTIEVVGARSSADPFFSKQAGGIDEQDVRKAALANWEVRAVTALLGLGNMLEADLTKNGIAVAAIPTFSYKKGGAPGGDKTFITEPQAKRLYTLAHGSGWNDDQIKAVLLKKGYDSSLKIPRSEYEAIVERFQKNKPGDVIQGEE